MTSPPPARGTARYRCDTCGKDFSLSWYRLARLLGSLIHTDERGRDCLGEIEREVAVELPSNHRGILVQIEGGAVTPAVVEEAIERGVAVIDFGADDRAGVTLPIGVQPVGRDQLVPAGPGEVDQIGERGHDDSIATAGAERTANRCAPDAHAFARGES